MPQTNSRHGGIIGGLLCAAATLFLFLFLAGVVVVRTVHVKSMNTDDGGEVAIDTPAGRLNIHASDHMNPAINGVPVYPGAWRADEGGAHIEWTSKDGDTDKNLYVIGGEFRTNDSVSQVVDFYRKQLPSLIIVSREDESAHLEYKEGGYQRLITIEQRGGRHDDETTIAVATIGDRASN